MLAGSEAALLAPTGIGFRHRSCVHSLPRLLPGHINRHRHLASQLKPCTAAYLLALPHPPLPQIATVSADTAAAFGISPRVALMSYSTGSSGSGPQVGSSGCARGGRVAQWEGGACVLWLSCRGVTAPKVADDGASGGMVSG
jgi:hypothetical protein